MPEETFDKNEPKKLKLELKQQTDSNSSQNKTCAHFLKRKKRFCKMTVAKGRDYCGEHEPQKLCGEDEETLPDSRIPCPLDSKHSVYKKNLNKHLKICNSRQKDDEPAYIQKGINTGETEEGSAALSDLKLSDLSEAELMEIVNKVEEIFQRFIEGKILTSTARHNSLDEELSKSEYGKETRKHLMQAAALLGILDEEQQLQDITSFIEFGAGKGQLAFYLAQLLKEHKDSQVILLDRMSLRHKKDNKIEDKSLVHRIRVDIADFCMSKLDLLEKTKRVVAVSKHLCGAATDLTIRCITHDSNENRTTDFVMIALCCHHRCDWKTFVGKEFFQAHNITPRQFVVITKMVSWAICGTGMSRERRRALESKEQSSITNSNSDRKDATQKLTLAERESIGLKCKRILDFARLEYLRAHSYDSYLKFYVPSDITLENVCLLAKRRKIPG